MSASTLDQANHSSISNYLRWMGFILLLIAVIHFMIQGLNAYVPAYHPWIIPAFTLLLAGCGLLCGYAMGENKGARIFWGLATAVVPAQFSQIGAMIHSYGFGSQGKDFGGWNFEDITLTLIFLNLLFTAIVIMPITYTGFAILARKRAKALMGAFFLGNAAVLLPSREAPVTFALLISLTFFFRFLDRRMLRQESSMRLWEGVAARGILWIPVLVILGRGFFYPPLYMPMAFVLALAAVFLISDSQGFFKAPAFLYAGQRLGAVLAVAAWLIFAYGLIDSLAYRDSAAMLWVYLPLAGLLFLLSGKVMGRGSTYRLLGASIAAYAALFYLFDQANYGASVVCLGVGFGLSLAGLNAQEKWPFMMGAACVMSGILFYLRYAIDLYRASPWLSLAALGLGALLLASWLEKDDRRALQLAKQSFNRFKAWK